jgi:hypothetical protein
VMGDGRGGKLRIPTWKDREFWRETPGDRDEKTKSQPHHKPNDQSKMIDQIK